MDFQELNKKMNDSEYQCNEEIAYVEDEQERLQRWLDKQASSMAWVKLDLETSSNRDLELLHKNLKLLLRQNHLRDNEFMKKLRQKINAPVGRKAVSRSETKRKAFDW